MPALPRRVEQRVKAVSVCDEAGLDRCEIRLEQVLKSRPGMYQEGLSIAFQVFTHCTLSEARRAGAKLILQRRVPRTPPLRIHRRASVTPRSSYI